MPSTVISGISGTSTIVPANGIKTTDVFKVQLNINIAGTLSFMDGTTTVLGPIIMSTGTPYYLPYDGIPWFSASPGNDLIVIVSGVSVVNGKIVYNQN